MFGLLKRLFGGMPAPAGPPRRIATIDAATSLISDRASWQHRVLVAQSDAKDTVRLCEYPLADVEQCMLGLRFQFRSDGSTVNAYPEIWVVVDGLGEFFSKGLNYRLKGNNDWIHCELPFYLREGQRANLLKLNVVFDRPGSVSIQNIELYVTPLE